MLWGGRAIGGIQAQLRGNGASGQTQAQGQAQGLGAALQGRLRSAWTGEDTRRRHKRRAGEQPGGQGAPTRDGKTGWIEGPGQGTQGQLGRARAQALPRSPSTPPRPGARSAGRLAGRPHLLGDLGCIQLVPELSSQPREAVSTGCSLPSADCVPVSLQCCLLTPGHSEDPAQLPGAWHARELLQESRGQQQLLGAGCRGMAERSPSQEDTKGLAHRAQGFTLPHPAGGSETTQVLQQQVGAGGGRETHSHPASWGQPPTPGDPLTLKGSPLFTHPEAGSVCPSPPSGTGAADSWGALNPHPGQAKGQKAGDRPEREGVVAQLLGLQPCTPTGAGGGPGPGLPQEQTQEPCTPTGASGGPGRGARARAPPGADTGALHPHGSQGRTRAGGSQEQTQALH